ncbi:hypothetical protein [Micromonospora aurantiaca (nom. illeg.)]|uniref:hypothetical protein n=1 Tax=Micromonospora aurantiaca (nom. illeg.) TaxID=47850 RepID=UPI0016575F75|nr:hypothetical protein [Micromonospora aurantiaca]MBC9005082.1 hypothetical protein [Micromonospora aurantiaca]
MTEQESRWSLAHTGNRVLLAVAVGVVLGGLCNATADLPTGAHVLTIVGIAAVTYLLVTLLRRPRR